MTITVARGDGIGPEIMEAALNILDAGGANLTYIPVEIGEKVYLSGERTGISDKTWEAIRQSDAFFKAPITTPQGGGFKSLNVTIRTTLGLYANIRPCVSYAPFVATKHPVMDVVIVRENEEDLYTGIEYRLSQDTVQALKIITRSGCEKIIRYAFEYALQHNRKKVTCFTKDNILKMSDGLFHQVFREIGENYPTLEKEHWIIDIGAAKLADTPEAFDVIVMPNLYGDILSDIAAQITGSVGLAGSANIGVSGAMFEAIHGSAPKRAGQDIANPSGLILASVMMLNYLGKGDVATLIHNAWLKTLEEGIHTYDIFKEGISKKNVGTQDFAKNIIQRLGQVPTTLPPVNYQTITPIKITDSKKQANVQKTLQGIDLFIEYQGELSSLLSSLKKCETQAVRLKMIGNRGVSVWPNQASETLCSDIWRCRFYLSTHQQTLTLQENLLAQGLQLTQTTHLFLFNNSPGYTLSQDEQ